MSNTNNSSYPIIEVVGASSKDFEDAVGAAITAVVAKGHQPKWFEVVSTRGAISSAQITKWQVTLKIGVDGT